MLIPRAASEMYGLLWQSPAFEDWPTLSGGCLVALTYCFKTITYPNGQQYQQRHSSYNTWDCGNYFLVTTMVITLSFPCHNKKEVAGSGSKILRCYEDRI